MADYLADFVPDFVKDEQPREIILKLGHMVTNRIPYKLGLKKLTKYDPEYWGLSLLLSDEEAEVALKMGLRKPRTLPQIMELTGKSQQELEPLLEHMSWSGVLEYNWENPQHEKQWVLPMFVPGSAEFSNMNQQLLDQHPEMGRFFERMSRLPLESVTPMVPPGGAGIGMHVIPVEKAIEAENTSIGIEHISHWLDKYDGKYAASPCSCRRSRLTYDEGCADDPEGWCIAVGDMADYVVDWLDKYDGKYAASPCSCRRSRLTYDEGCADDPEGWCIAVGDMADYVVETDKGGRYITREEALAIFKQAEDNGFVHQITNIDGENKIFAICNCNVNVCYALRTSQLFNTPNLSRSAYVARVETADCATPCGLPSCSTPPTCPAVPTWPGWRRRTAWPAASAWRSVPPVR